MARVLHTPRSDTDLLIVWNGIAEHSVVGADKMIRRIDKAFWTLADHPQAGTNQDRYHTGLRAFVVGNYVIYYVAIEDGIEVYRVLHAARDHEGLL